MRKLDLAQTLGLLANAGVIAGIVFLGLELQQNNDQLRSQTRTNIYQMQTQIQRDIFANVGGVADLVAKAQQGEQLTGIEINRLTAFRGYVLRTMEFMFREDTDGARDSTQWMVVLFEAIPGFREFYEESKNYRDPDFLQFIENDVLSQLEP